MVENFLSAIKPLLKSGHKSKGYKNTRGEWIFEDVAVQLAWETWQMAMLYRTTQNPDRERINNIGQELRNFRMKDDTTLIVQVQSFPTNPDTLIESFEVTVNDGVRSATGSAVDLYDAFYMARAKIKEVITETAIESVEITDEDRAALSVPVPKLKFDPTKLKVPSLGFK
jgi:hypothetical protein